MVLMSGDCGATTPWTRVADMMKRISIYICTLPAIAILLIYILSWWKAIPCLGNKNSKLSETYILFTNGQFEYMHVVNIELPTNLWKDIREINKELNYLIFRWYRKSPTLIKYNNTNPPIYIRVITSTLIVPLYVPLILSCIYPTIAFIRGPYLRHRRCKKCLCLNCAYNLTGNISGVCPECGEKI